MLVTHISILMIFHHLIFQQPKERYGTIICR